MTPTMTGREFTARWTLGGEPPGERYIDVVITGSYDFGATPPTITLTEYDYQGARTRRALTLPLDALLDIWPTITRLLEAAARPHRFIRDPLDPGRLAADMPRAICGVCQRPQWEHAP